MISVDQQITHLRDVGPIHSRIALLNPGEIRFTASPITLMQYATALCATSSRRKARIAINLNGVDIHRGSSFSRPGGLV